MYSIEFSQTADKQFNKLDIENQKRVGHVLERIKIRPFSFVKPLIGTNYYRLRSGDYRLIIDIKQDKMIIFVIELGHRSTIYK